MFQSLFIAILTALSLQPAMASQGPPNLDLETTSEEYRALLRSKTFTNAPVDAADPEEADLAKWLAFGVRNLQWVDLVNAHRTPENKISLSSAATQGGAPVSKPGVYNYKMIKEQWEIIEALLPVALKKVVFEGAPLTAEVPVTDREFSEWLMQVDRNYQSTARYKMMKPWQEELAQRASGDVRGYLSLREDAQVDQKLSHWLALTTAQKNQFSTALSQICWNSGSTVASCDQELASATTANKLVDFKNKYMPAGKENYDSFFLIPQGRSDATWTAANPNVFEIPFTNPHNETVLQYLQTNIQDEWKWDGWQLHLNFVEESSPQITHVVFVPGSTPHVNEIAGSEITMDANALLSEYDVKWTIRHEYGHVLGFPDCYFEFYDQSIEAYVNYQLDVTNLMCSRRGHLQKRHFDELKRVYYK